MLKRIDLFFEITEGVRLCEACAGVIELPSDLFEAIRLQVVRSRRKSLSQLGLPRRPLQLGFELRNLLVELVQPWIVASVGAASQSRGPIANRRVASKQAGREIVWLVRSIVCHRSVQDATLPAPRAPSSDPV